MSEDHKLEHIYYEILIVIERLLKQDNDALAVAAVLTSQAMGLYKTVLSEDDYDRMIDSIVDKKDNIRPFEARALH